MRGRIGEGDGGTDSGGLTDGTDLARQSGVLKMDWQQWALKASNVLLDSRSGRREFAENSGGSRLAVNRERETRRTDMSLAAIDFPAADAATLKPHLVVRWSAQNAGLMTPAIAPASCGVSAIRANPRLERLNMLAEVLARPIHSLSRAIGAEYGHEAGRNQGAIDFGGWLPARVERSRETASDGGEASLRPGAPVGITPGGRVEREGPLLFARVATGAKLPSLYALGYPLIARPTLKPARAQSGSRD